VLELSHGLSRAQLDAIAALEQRCVAVDGGRLKLEWETLRSRSADEVNDVLWWDGAQLLGFVGLYCFDGHNVELAGMVDPQARRHGIATSIIDAAVERCRNRNYASVLLATPRHCEAGQHFAEHRGAVLDHCEHALVLHGEPVPGPAGPDVSIRAAQVVDAAAITDLLAAAFGDAPDDVGERIMSDRDRTLVVEQAGEAIGTVRLTRDGTTGGVYGFAIAPHRQGRGIGRSVLRRVCLQLRSEGAQRVGLEVATTNEHALGLYTSLGFELVTTEDYYAIPI
jgi:ribosomal protein S18 acetylase RimI-like enzyme